MARRKTKRPGFLARALHGFLYGTEAEKERKRAGYGTRCSSLKDNRAHFKCEAIKADRKLKKERERKEREDARRTRQEERQARRAEALRQKEDAEREYVLTPKGQKMREEAILFGLIPTGRPQRGRGRRRR